MSGKDDRSKSAPARAQMLGWYDPRQLARTGVQTVISSLFGSRADYRAMQALGHKDFSCHLEEGGGERSEFWLDYVSDTGDGFAPTYAVAQMVARESVGLTVKDVKREFPRGEVLVMGGDEVYPTPTQARYDERFVGPYASALPYDKSMTDAQRPRMFAIPGNHDWYDGLGAFMNLFSSGRYIGNWTTPQKRSYFAIQLPYRVWLVGVDLQLESDVDNAQVEAFLELDFKAGDRVILCTSEPDWAYRPLDVHGAEAAPKNLDRLRDGIEKRGAAIVLQLAGDQHHYRRQSDKTETRHMVTAGGGGAFTHPTHTTPPGPLTLLGREYTCLADKDYPPRKQSVWLALENWKFIPTNPWFGVTTAGLYVILGLVMPRPADAGGSPGHRAAALLLDGAVNMERNTASMVWLMLVVGGFVAFTDTRVNWYRWVAGTTHASTHLVASLVGALIATYARIAVEANVREFFDGLWSGAHPVLAEKLGAVASLVMYIAGLAAWGYVVGAMLFGAYLMGSAIVFGRHGNEAFSSLKLDRYKHFLKLCVKPDAIDVYAVGLDAVPPADAYAWDHDTRRWTLTSGHSLEPRLIDHFTARADPAP